MPGDEHISTLSCYSCGVVHMQHGQVTSSYGPFFISFSEKINDTLRRYNSKAEVCENCQSNTHSTATSLLDFACLDGL